MSRFLWIAFGVLGVLMAGAVALWLAVPEGSEGWQNFAVGLITEIVGIYLTVFLIERLISRDKERERRKHQTIAFEQLRKPLQAHLKLLVQMHKAAAQSRPERAPGEAAGPFDDRFFEELRYLDLTAEAPSPTGLPMDWLHYVEGQCRGFRDTLDRTVEKYAVFLDSDLIELMEEIIRSPFMSHMAHAEEFRERQRRRGLPAHENLLAARGMQGLVREYAGLFERLLDYYNRNVPEQDRVSLSPGFWAEEESPRLGSARKEPPADQADPAAR